MNIQGNTSKTWSVLALVMLVTLALLFHVQAKEQLSTKTTKDHRPPHIPSEFQADTQFKYLFFNLKGPMIYSYDKQSYVVDSKVPIIGSKQRDIFRYDKNIHYQLSQNPFGGGWKCVTEYLRGQIYPMAIPPLAQYEGTEVIDGVKTEKYALDWGFYSANFTLDWWANPKNNSLVQFEVSNKNFGPFFDFKYEFSNFRAGIPSGPVFSPPDDVNCPPPKCASPIDVLMLLDGSRSISSQSWDKAKDFATKVLNKLKFNDQNPKQGPRYGLVQFSNSASIEASLSADHDTLENDIKNMGQMNAGTDTSAGLDTSQNVFNNDGRKQAPHILFVVTDGEHNQGKAPGPVAKQMQDKGTEIFAIGVGDGINKDELHSMASTPKDKHVFTVNDWSRLDGILDDLFKNSC
eukprot:gb/GECH01004866.1/.p1 GENE.gb/GECH01004866.1/~~gb/GECH01004866.1/.p1  ORF type:complete len:404 (+),score=115.40 gb/GECH01004866.1/:1-1212(+)